jgi:hypothetical protein
MNLDSPVPPISPLPLAAAHSAADATGPTGSATSTTYTSLLGAAVAVVPLTGLWTLLGSVVGLPAPWPYADASFKTIGVIAATWLILTLWFVIRVRALARRADRAAQARRAGL